MCKKQKAKMAVSPPLASPLPLSHTRSLSLHNIMYEETTKTVTHTEGAKKGQIQGENIKVL